MNPEAKNKKRDHASDGGTAPTLPSAGDPHAKTVKLVCEGVAQAAKEIGNDGPRILHAVAGILQNSVREAMEAGGSLVLGAKAIVVGVLRGTGEKEAAAVKTLSQTSQAVTRHAAQLSGDLSAAVKGLVLGAIASAKDIGVDRAQAATAAARGALDGAEEAGSAATETVRATLKEEIGGVKVALPEPIRN